MSALMKKQTIGEWAEIDLKVKLPSKELTLVSATLTRALDAVGQKVREVMAKRFAKTFGIDYRAFL